MRACCLSSAVYRKEILQTKHDVPEGKRKSDAALFLRNPSLALVASAVSHATTRRKKGKMTERSSYAIRLSLLARLSPRSPSSARRPSCFRGTAGKPKPLPMSNAASMPRSIRTWILVPPYLGHAPVAAPGTRLALPPHCLPKRAGPHAASTCRSRPFRK